MKMQLEPEDHVELMVVTCKGDSHQRGVIQGEELRGRISDGVGRWLEQIEARHGIDADQYRENFLADTGYLGAIERRTPELLEEVSGIAEGSNQSFSRILAYNLMDEEWSYGNARGQQAAGCTMAAFRADDGNVVIGQTMDIPSIHDGTQTVVIHQRPRQPDLAVVTAAGMIGLMGVNSHGLGIVVNNLAMLPSSSEGLPVAFVMRGALGQATLEAACAFVEGVPHAVGQHYAIGSPEGLVSYEAAANGVIRDQEAIDRFAHTNHPLVNLDVDADAEESYERSNSRRRFERIWEQLRGLREPDDLERALSDTLAPISCSISRGFMTFSAMVAELTVPPVLRVAPGPPHERSFVTVSFRGLDRAAAD
jgi:isopenicillin-N N-acyltransferase like protein